MLKLLKNILMKRSIEVNVSEQNEGDVQKYVVIYRAGGKWAKTFARAASDAVKLAESKISGNSQVTDVWACQWKDKTCVPFSLRGDGMLGRKIVLSMIEEIRQGMPEKKRGDIPKNKSLQVVNPVSSPQKEKKKKQKLTLVKEVATYKPPYTVKVAI